MLRSPISHPINIIPWAFLEAGDDRRWHVKGQWEHYKGPTFHTTDHLGQRTDVKNTNSFPKIELLFTRMLKSLLLDFGLFFFLRCRIIPSFLF